MNSVRVFLTKYIKVSQINRANPMGSTKKKTDYSLHRDVTGKSVTSTARFSVQYLCLRHSGTVKVAVIKYMNEKEATFSLVHSLSLYYGT